MAEIDRVADRPGIRGFLMGCYPNGTLHPSADDDKVWRALTDAADAAEHPRQLVADDARVAPVASCPATAASSTRRTG